MDILYIGADSPPSRIENLVSMPESGLVWINIQRGEDASWPQTVHALSGVMLHEGHVEDAANERHPSYVECTDDYEMFIFQSLSPVKPDEDFTARATAFFMIHARLLVTISPPDSRSVEAVQKRLLSGKGRAPDRPAGILHLLLNDMVDRLLGMREELVVQLGQYRESLLSPNSEFDDWPLLLDYQKKMFFLEMICEGQADAITIWRDNTDFEIDDQISVWLNDVQNHIHRVTNFSVYLQREIDSIIQLHFSAVAHRTNAVVKLLTLISAIFLPLMLIVGIYGMNFRYMPELDMHYGYFIVLGGMALLGTSLLVYFKRKKWI